jgi:uncharacterized protein (DUF433 family)
MGKPWANHAHSRRTTVLQAPIKRTADQVLYRERTTGFAPATLTLAKREENRPSSPSQSPDVVFCPPIRPPAPPTPPILYTGLPSPRKRNRLLAQWVHGYDGGMDRITVNPRQMGGVPCIRGLRIPVATVVGMIADGMTPDEIVAELPPLELDDISAALRFAADAVADREIPLQPTA